MGIAIVATIVGHSEASKSSRQLMKVHTRQKDIP